jgi:transposase
MSSFATTILELLVTIPGVGKRVAEVIIAEIGVDMSVFASDAHLASWAAVCPGNNSSAGKHYSGATRKGNVWLLDALTQAAWAAGRVKDDYLSAQFWRLARRIGKTKAVVAVAHSILVIVYHVIATGQPYHDLGADYFTKRVDPERRARHLTRQLADLGYQVTLTKAA